MKATSNNHNHNNNNDMKARIFLLLLITLVLLTAAAAATRTTTEATTGTRGGVRRTVLEQFEQLYNISLHSLRSNIIPGTHNDSYLRAGAHQFGGLWTRDFAFSVDALLLLYNVTGEQKYRNTVRTHLSKILENVRKQDNLVPRLLDSYTIAQRYELAFFHIYPTVDPDKLQPYYTGGAGSHLSIDGNVLVVLSVLKYVKQSRDYEFWRRYEPILAKILNFYQAFLEYDGDSVLIKQPPFSDWQDNVSREGKCLYINVLYWACVKALASDNLLSQNITFANQLQYSIKKHFFDKDSNLYVSIITKRGTFISLDGIYLMLFYNFLTKDEEVEIYKNLQKHPLWIAPKVGIPGYVTYPDYPTDWIPFIERMLGVQHYSDSLYHSMSIVWAAYIALRSNDTELAFNILNKMQSIAIRDQNEIQEVFLDEPELPIFHTTFFWSEHPFTWGSATLLHTLLTFARLSIP
jgi:hypothetical protein